MRGHVGKCGDRCREKCCGVGKGKGRCKKRCREKSGGPNTLPYTSTIPLPTHPLTFPHLHTQTHFPTHPIHFPTLSSYFSTLSHLFPRFSFLSPHFQTLNQHTLPQNHTSPTPLPTFLTYKSVAKLPCDDATSINLTLEA